MNQYPEDCIQSFTSGDWWIRDDQKKFEFGALVWSYVPFFDQIPYRLTATRTDPHDHKTATVKAEPLHTSKAPADESPLPVAGLPHLRGAHGWMVNRMKKRPCLVLFDDPRIPIDKALIRGMTSPSTYSYAIVAPFYGVDQEGRAGYNPGFVKKIKYATYPQWFWDMLPLNSTSESILRLDQIHPVGHHHQSFEHTGYTLGDNARKMMREWLEWYMGFKPSEAIEDFRGFIAEFDKST